MRRCDAESLGRRIALGMVAIVAGALLLSLPQNDALRGLQLASLWPALAALLACALWALDDNVTRKVALNDASWSHAHPAVSGSIRIGIGTNP